MTLLSGASDNVFSMFFSLLYNLTIVDVQLLLFHNSTLKKSTSIIVKRQMLYDWGGSTLSLYTLNSMDL